MDILLHLDNKTTLALETLAHQYGQTPDALALEALQYGLTKYPTQQWPQAVLTFQGIPDMPAFESYRAELLSVQDGPLV